jgi:beta-mannosidase
MQKLDLSSNWQFKQLPSEADPLGESGTPDGWYAATVPGTVHTDLMRADQIPDPFWRLNENDVQWVGQADWLYRCTFDVPGDLLAPPYLDLCFDGLDTFATVWLNGTPILKSDNMFVPARIAVKQWLKAAGNVLIIRFESALLRGHTIESQYGPRQVWNGDTSRLYVRKAQYHYGWDWGPTLLTAGLWRPVRLEAYSVRIVDLNPVVALSDDLSRAEVDIQIELAGDYANGELRIEILDAQGATADSFTANTDQPTLSLKRTLDQPALWYPNGYGEHPLYTVKASLGEDTKSVRFGVRRLRVVQEALTAEPGTSFYFEVNHIPLFSGGANWIPADSFTPRIDRETYQRWLDLAVDAHMIMLRVWGGGIYEADTFYDLCDERGLLIWQDFMFACGIYPAEPWFVESVRAEVTANVRRLRHHACLALWCGNNEDYQIAESFGLYDSTVTEALQTSNFPARYLYETVLPELTRALDPSRFYWPGSAYGGKSVQDSTVGDRHTWDVWHGVRDDYQAYPKYEGRFVSEFGMEAMPVLATIEAFTQPEDRATHTTVMEFHNKATIGPTNLDYYIQKNLPIPNNFNDYVYATQFIQSESTAAAVNGWRRRWGGPGHYAVSGALIWQLNDCWPVTSWALVDYALRPKPAYYRARRCFAPLAIDLALDGTISVVNGTTDLVDTTLNIQVFDLTGACLHEESRDVTLLPSRAAEQGRFDTAQPVTHVFLINKQGQVTARGTFWAGRAKDYAYPDPGFKVARIDADTLRISVDRPARGVFIQAQGLDAQWSDNMIDLLPGDPQTLTAPGVGHAALTLQSVGHTVRL